MCVCVRERERERERECVCVSVCESVRESGGGGAPHHAQPCLRHALPHYRGTSPKRKCLPDYVTAGATRGVGLHALPRGRYLVAARCCIRICSGMVGEKVSVVYVYVYIVPWSMLYTYM